MRIEQKSSGFGDLGMITHECPCGSSMWNIQASFEDYEISFYNLDMECAHCGTRAITPTPLDDPERDCLD